MKCPTCGSPLSIEDKTCPYCNTVNLQAKQHQTDMRRYQKEFAKTKEKVVKTAGVNTRFQVLLILVALAALLNVGLLICRINSYEIEDWLAAKTLDINYDENNAALKTFEETGDYTGLYECYRNLRVPYDNALYEYNIIANVANYYTYVWQDISNLTHPLFTSYYSTSDEILSDLANKIDYIYEVVNSSDKSYYAEYLQGLHGEALADITQKMELMLSVFCKLTDEDIAGLGTMGKQERAVLIARRLGIYE